MAKRKNPAAVALGRLGGKVVTEKKRAHLRRASKLPRPGRRKFAAGDRVIGVESAPASFRGRRGTIVHPTDRRAEYLVPFDADSEMPQGKEAVYSWWIEKTR